MSAPARTDKGGAVTVGSRRHDLSDGLDQRHVRGPDAQHRIGQQSVRRLASATGTVNWTRQFGGVDGQSTGAGIAIAHTAPAFSTRWACRAARSASTSRSTSHQQTTLRAGDCFQIQLQGARPHRDHHDRSRARRYNSLATKINAQLADRQGRGELYGSAENMKITVNPGSTVNLIAGPADFDALSRLGIAPGVITRRPRSTDAQARHNAR